MNLRQVFAYEYIIDFVWNGDYTYYFQTVINRQNGQIAYESWIDESRLSADWY